MVIACLGWGSLIWKPDALPLASEWFMDGPALPVEFSRIGDGGELATAICLNAPPCRVLWSVLATDSLEQACSALREREQIPAEREDGIGVYRVEASSTGPLAQWASERQIDALIWTALPPRFRSEGRLPKSEDALAYLRSLTGEKLEHARDYIRQVPAQIDTPYRRDIQKQLGWK
ncbi:hypothetical protein IFT47_19840 [Pseudomonas sp. CFBP 13711]|uniref:hypothetical protein n=1 Tax=unclassified Pseudomonas TaxID=196821 RepID=UPI001780EB58|nr:MULTISPECIES: hypothetical protein [unclassified Pseudomonas]MBD8708885.1 hypothetical protein [Pseudomonas sp. CFBP 13711]MBD8712271.1 hypothetical protein [Pseudomonas sp. CFBP 13715]